MRKHNKTYTNHFSYEKLKIKVFVLPKADFDIYISYFLNKILRKAYRDNKKH